MSYEVLLYIKPSMNSSTINNCKKRFFFLFHELIFVLSEIQVLLLSRGMLVLSIYSIDLFCSFLFVCCLFVCLFVSIN